MFLSTPLSLTFFFFYTSSINSVYAHHSGSAAASSVDLFAVAYPIVAYPFASDKHAATTYLVACPTGSDIASCQFAQPYTLIQGSKTLHFEFTSPMDDDVVQSFTFDCALHGTTSMGCKATGLNNDFTSAPITTSEAFTYTGQQAASFFQPIRLVTDSRALLTYTPGVETKMSALTTSSKGGERTGSSSMGKGSPTATSVVSTGRLKIASTVSATANSHSTESVSSTGTVSSTTSVALTKTVVIEPIEGTSSTTAFPALTTSGASTPIPSISTTSGAGANGGRFLGLLLACAGTAISIGVF